ncbi:hypothetical protein A2U01_0077406 [Trifolium medium]|uniref:Uncharacterized protein n=1 Tax=Trifolium medium TaxID=97028 RepID=A0A392T781_9FABA|nr:hypothetical protein [Trifolium medium]
MVEKLVDRLEEEDDKESQENYPYLNNIVDDEDMHVEEEIVIPSQAGDAIVTPSAMDNDHPVGAEIVFWG